MAKTLIDVNEEYLAAAQEVLHTADQEGHHQRCPAGGRRARGPAAGLAAAGLWWLARPGGR